MNQDKKLLHFPNGTFHIKTKIRTLDDLAELTAFFQDMKKEQEDCDKTIQLNRILEEVLPDSDVVSLVCDYMTHMSRDLRIPYVDMVSTMCRDPCHVYFGDPLKQYMWECHRDGITPDI